MLLTEEQRAIRDTARAFAEGEIAPHAAAWERDGGPPRDLYRRMGEVGLMGGLRPARAGRRRGGLRLVRARDGGDRVR